MKNIPQQQADKKQPSISAKINRAMVYSTISILVINFLRIFLE